LPPLAASPRPLGARPLGARPLQFDGSPDDDELITNDDEWLWGEHKKKVSSTQRGGQARARGLAG
jgi:hypothetical protein